MFQIFAYLQKYSRSKLVFDRSPIEWRTNQFFEENWDQFYPEEKEILPPNIPEEQGLSLEKTCSLILTMWRTT